MVIPAELEAGYSFNWQATVRFAITYHREKGIKCRVRRNRFGVWQAWPLYHDHSKCLTNGWYTIVLGTN